MLGCFEPSGALQESESWTSGGGVCDSGVVVVVVVLLDHVAGQRARVHAGRGPTDALHPITSPHYCTSASLNANANLQLAVNQQRFL